MKVFISQSMRNKTIEEELAERKEIVRQIKAEYGNEVEFLGSYAIDKWGSTDKAFFCTRMARGQGLPQGA